MDTTKIAYLMLAVCFSWLPALSGTTTTNPFHAGMWVHLLRRHSNMQWFVCYTIYYFIFEWFLCSFAALTDNLTQCGAVVCVAETEVCREDSFCECKPHFEDQGSFQCVPCPAEGQYCRGCCISDALTCYHGVCRRCSLDSNGNCM